MVEKGDEVLAKLNDPFALEYVERLEVDELTKAAPIHRKVWVIDQDEHIMILFPEDY